jgi:hypothetical protein
LIDPSKHRCPFVLLSNYKDLLLATNLVIQNLGLVGPQLNETESQSFMFYGRIVET